MKIKAFSGKYTILGNLEDLKIQMRCSRCEKWVEPEQLILGRAHIYGLHCGIMQDIGCVTFQKRE